MKKVFLLIAAGLLLFAQKSMAQSIKANDNPKGWMIETKSSVYQLVLTDDNEVVPVFFGHKSHASGWAKQNRTQHNGPYTLSEIPVRGIYADKDPVVEAVFADGVRDIELQFVSADIITVDKRQTLKITMKDKHYPLVITSFIRVIPEYDILEKWIEVKNTDKKQVIKLDNLKSGSVLLSPNRYYVNHHSGQWVREFQLQKTELTAGTKTLQGRDFYSFENTPWFAVTNQPGDDETGCEVWYGQVHYSGNWKIDLSATHAGFLQISGGINFWDTSWELKAGETFTSPKMSVGYTTGGTDQAARNTADYVRNEILPAKIAEIERPVLYNSWYATGFDVNEEQQLALAKVAKEIGVELFVIDDGWFKGRKDDHAGLGDWEVDKEKFPNGLNPMIEKINAMGLDFGIWVEPEMINPNSDLYRKHPDWVLHFPNRSKTEWRYQLTLNLAREDVYQYLLKSMTDLLKNHNIKFIKWDRNRGLTQPGWPAAPLAMQREVRIRYVQNLYRMVEELRRQFPDVIFENCSSGGGRPDLGMLSVMDQTWASDNTDPVDRLFIQYGYLSAYPANTMVCWTNSSDAHRVKPSLDFVFDVAMQGDLGIGQNITRWNDEQKSTAKRKIEEYKSIRPLIQKGDVYRLKSPFKGSKVAIEYVAKNRNEAVLLCYNLGETMQGSTNEVRESRLLKLQGLTPDRLYTLNLGDKELKLTGSYLMDIGIPWPVRGAYNSTIVKIK